MTRINLSKRRFLGSSAAFLLAPVLARARQPLVAANSEQDSQGALIAADALPIASPEPTKSAEPSQYQVGVYYFPNYHVDPRNEAAHGKGWTEWELVRRGEPKFPGHAQPKVPLWGHEDESKPEVMARKIDAAADHGITHFIFDWYWYDGKPFLNRALEEGFLKAHNVSRLGFALMWANHDWLDIQPAKRSGQTLQYHGAIDETGFDTVTDYIIENYFKHPSYQKIAGCPYFSIYELMTLVGGLGGVDKTHDALARFRDKTRKAGFPDLHLNAVVWGVQILPGEQTIHNSQELLAATGFDSVTSYVWIHHVGLPDFPASDYVSYMDQSTAYWNQAATEFGLPYYPNVSMGWDPSPRTVQSDVFEPIGYPFTATLKNNTPAHFREALLRARTYLDQSKLTPKLLTINAWNEWTEGSYLEPDTVHKYGYLEALRDVFGTRSQK